MFMEKRIIVVLAAVSQKQLENDGCDVEQECETITHAKKRAKHYLTEEYMHSAESTTMLGYAQVKVNGIVEHDFFGKGAK
jgi:hypothetical protein